MNEYLAKRYDTGATVRVTVENGKIVSASDTVANTATEQPTIAPGFFDIQINGGWGVEFSSASLDVEQVRRVFDRLPATGVFRFCPTFTTNSSDALIHAARTVAETLALYPQYEPLVAGIHLEGPFISTADGPRGAHPLEFCRTRYDHSLIDAVVDASAGRLKMVTLSPEYDGADEFIEQLTRDGILVALGHTNATPAQIFAASNAGARLSTHLSNGTHPMIPKGGNYFFAQLLDDTLAASVIADGFHVSPLTLELIRRVKGTERMILISDQAQVAGLAPGKYSTGLCELELLPNGKIVLASDRRLLAAASVPISRGVCNLAAVSGLSLAECFDCATKNPAKLLDRPAFSNGHADDFLAVGAPADFLIFRPIPSRLGPKGIADTLESGRFEYQTIVWRGEEIRFS